MNLCLLSHVARVCCYYLQCPLLQHKPLLHVSSLSVTLFACYSHTLLMHRVKVAYWCTLYSPHQMDYKPTATRTCQGRTMEVGYYLHVYVW